LSLESTRLKVAVIGQGWWGKAIIRQLKDNAKIQVIKAVDVNPGAGEWVRSQGIDFTTDYDATVGDPNIEGVILCTPHSFHTEQVSRAAMLKKHVFCEKPLALNWREALASVEACRSNGVVLGIGHEHRFKTPMIDVMKMVKSGELGTIMQSEATFTMDNLANLASDNWRLSNAEAPAGPMTATGIHALDLCIGVHGPADCVLANVRKLATNLPNGDTVALLISFRSGANALITSISGSPYSIRFAVFGSHGWVEVRDKAHPETPEGWVLTKCMRGGKAQTVDYPPMSPVLANLEAFADAARGRSSYPIQQGEMVANIAALEAIFKSAGSGKVEQVEDTITA
jgi:predicted dehydrogenase